MVNFTYDELNRLLVMFEEVIRETKIKVMGINLYEKEVKWKMSANKKHNNKYDYTKVKYIDYYSKIIIICPFHGKVK
jgi:hypothetical protein